MKRFFEPIAKGILLTTIIVLFSIMSFSATYYVSSSGNNSNNGTTTLTPWQTLSKVNSTAFLAGDIVLFKKGDTFYGSIIVPSSGSSTSPITFGAYGTGANPIITGFTSVSTWTNLGSNIWESTNAVSTLSTCNMVAINGVNTPMGTYPNADAPKSGYFTYQTSTPNSITSSSLNGSPNWTGAEVVIKTSNFSLERRMITSQSGGTLGWATATGRGPENNFGFFIQNDTRTLDKQNEWYYNPTTKKIRVYSTSTPTNVKVASVDMLITITKNYITIDGIDFTGANTTAIWNDPTDSPIKTRIFIKNCNISFVGTSGVELRCSYQNIENNTISNSNGTAIRGANASYVTIKNNKVINTGLNKGMGVGHGAVAVNYSPNSLVEYNSIINTGFNGITFQSESVTVKNNFIDTFCQLLDDGGGIYTYTGANLPALSKILLQGNIIVNGVGAPDGTALVFPAIAAGIYLDNKSKNVEVSGNSIFNCRKYGLYFNDASYVNAHDNTVFATWETGVNAYSAQFKINHTWTPTTFQSNFTINNNVFFSKSANQYCFDLSSPINNILNFGIANNNVYARPLDDNKSIRADQPAEWSGSREYKTLAEWQSFSGDDANSKKSPQVITSESELQFEYNATQTAKTVTLSRAMIDAKGAKYANSITLQPYTSVVLLKDATIAAVTVPDAATSVLASAGNATASVTFTGPVNNGGSVITGYSVTSIPAGGIDSNAGSTSLTHTITGLTNGTSYTFTVKATNSVGTSLASAASNSVIPKAPVLTATGITLTGPASGNVNSASTNFTVTPNNPYTGTITLTPTGAGSAGLSAKVLTFSNSSAAQTFTITPTVAGIITLTTTNNGSLTNPANLTYTANAVVPGVPTSVIATAGIASASVSFAAPSNNGGSGITGYTVTSIPAGGTDLNAGSTSLSHAITGLTSGTSYTFTVKATNLAGTSLASSASNLIIPTAPVATTFTFTGPTSGNVDNASANFTVTPNNLFTGTITLTPTGAGSAGLSAKVLTFSNSSAAQTFTITPTVAGIITLTATNNGSLTNSANLTYTANAVVPGVPTSVIATAGDATATVTFVAPTNNGGSAINGYAVTSIPAGGTDINAGSTSNTHTITGLTNGTSYTFTVKATNSAGTSLASSASNLAIPKAPVATAFTFTGPTSGNVNNASANFTVTPNNLYTGTITLTPSGTGSNGLTAIVLTFSNSSAAQTFTITPTVAGIVTLSTTNNGSLTNPANLTYTANAVVPDSPTSVVADAGDATATVTFVAPTNNGGSAITGYTVTSIPAGGTDTNAGSTSLTHTITGLTNGISYTFTVNATNIAGNSVASNASNSVNPIVPKDVTPPVVSAFVTAASANSLAVSISAFTATDNIGVTGYLLTETSSSPSVDMAGWTASAPLTYNYSTAGTKALFAWVKDEAGNVSASQNRVVTITTNQTVDLNSHFKTVWQGENGQNHMNIIVFSATLEGISLSANDEIALFSGSICVGAKKLIRPINSADNTTFITIPASQNDGSNNGFTSNDTIIFKIWDNKNQQEKLINSVVYLNAIPSWITNGKYAPGATSAVEIENYTDNSQTIALKKGYNLISTYLIANDPNVTSVTKTLYNQGNLIKMQDEAGNSFENWGSFGGWINKLGSIEKTEGYKIQVANDCSFQVIGKPITLPLDIPLKTGWNIISFPRIDMVDATAVIQTLIDQNKLVKVQDEIGNSIENWGIFGGWKNGIGNFIPGKAYKIKMNADAILTLQQNYLKSAIIIANSENAVHFSSEVLGNGSDHMNINILGLQESGMSIGDELAAFDGETCVGSLKITADHISNGTGSLIASLSTNDNSKDGFKVGNPILIYAWNQISGDELKVQAEVVNGQLSYEKNASVMIQIKSLATDARNIEQFVKIDVFPNPSQGKVTVRFSELPDSGSRIDILDISGRKVASRLISGTSEEFNLDSQPSGLYIVKSIIGSDEIIRKLIINK